VIPPDMYQSIIDQWQHMEGMIDAPHVYPHRDECRDILENRILPYNFFGENFKPVLDPTSSHCTLDSDICKSRKRQRFSKDVFSTSPDLKSY